jgi:hypothetical protein
VTDAGFTKRAFHTDDGNRVAQLRESKEQDGPEFTNAIIGCAAPDHHDGLESAQSSEPSIKPSENVARR